ncbi:MAG: hypothetical protein IJ088_11445, partial [Clostridia bacterium]|nr:hypothetical protein [Clostridia bacterium]
MSIEDMEFNQMVTYGNHLYRHSDEIAEVYMKNSRTGVRKVIVDDNGVILDFPGFAYPDLVSLYNGGIPWQMIRFRSEIKKLDDQYALIWQIKPDGRYWEDDDGFGSNRDDEINLYARMDENGHFTEPFHLYSIFPNKLYGTDAEEQLNATLSMKEDPLTSTLEHVPEMLEAMKNLIKVPEEGTFTYDVPGTIYQAVFKLDNLKDEWKVEVDLKKRFTSRSAYGWL